jgi:type I restriction enzyme S subunit
VREWIVRHAHGATMANLNTSILSACPFVLPPLSEQFAIASILGALDDKIDLNRRMNETLEAMARAIFKDWFVDFGPTRAKMEGRAPYLAPDIWALFPDRLDDDGKPEGWTFRTLKELAAQSSGTIRTGPFGSQLHQADYSQAGTPVVMPTNLTEGEITEEGIARVDAEIAARLADHAMADGDIVYGRRGDIGRKALVGPDEAGWLCGTGCLRISIRSTNCPPIFIFHHLDRPEVKEWISTRAIGATMPNLNTGILGEVEILVPSPEVGARFVDTVDPVLQHCRANRREVKTLAATRDLLLPKLMSGEIRVLDAEKIVEAAQ